MSASTTALKVSSTPTRRWSALGVVVVRVRLEERVHALDGLRAQLGEEARDVLLVFSFLSGQDLGRLPLDGLDALLLLVC